MASNIYITDTTGAKAQAGLEHGTYLAVAADATNNLIDIVTGAPKIASLVSLMILRSGANVLADAVITLNGNSVDGNIRIVDATYTATAGDVVYWTVATEAADA